MRPQSLACPQLDVGVETVRLPSRANHAGSCLLRLTTTRHLCDGLMTPDRRARSRWRHRKPCERGARGPRPLGGGRNGLRAVIRRLSRRADRRRGMDDRNRPIFHGNAWIDLATDPRSAYAVEMPLRADIMISVSPLGERYRPPPFAAIALARCFGPGPRI
jgi:hypothetical protein